MRFADIDTHRSLLKSAFGRFSGNLFGFVSAPAVEVTIESGRQAGSNRVLRGSGVSIGHGTDCDLTLVDDAVADRHVEIEFSRSVFGVVAHVTALANGVALNGTELMTRQTARGVEMPLALNIHKTRIGLARPGQDAVAEADDEPHKGTRLLSRLDPVIILTCAAIGVLLLDTVIGATAPWGRPNQLVLYKDPVVQLDPAANEIKRDWLGELEAKAAERSIRDRLDMAYTEDGIIRVVGEVNTAEFEAVRAIQAWFDSQSGTPTILWDVARSVGLPTLPRIGMVRLSDPPMLLLTSGESVGLGDELSEGWLLQKVSQDAFTLVRGPETAVVPFLEVTP